MIEIQNTQLKMVSEFLSSMNLEAKSSRARVKLGKKVEERLMEFSQDVQELQKEYEGGELDSHFIELLSEKTYIDMGEYKDLMPHLEEALLEYNSPMQGDDAVAHDLLLDELLKFNEEHSEASQTKIKGEDE